METTQGPRPAPLDGIRVLDFSHQAAGPWATTLLGDLGADVLKVEKPGRGDSIRYGQGEDGFEVGSLNFWGLNRSKRSLTIDLGKPEGIALVHRLVSDVDVVVENFRPGVMDRKGIGYDELCRRNSRLVYCGITAFGKNGPLAQKPGMDLILQATGGIMSITGEAEGRPPVKAGPPVADIATGIYGALAVTAALYERERSGLGQRIDLAMLDAVVSLCADVALGAHVGGRVYGAFGSGHPDIVPYQAFRASDGYFIVACLTGAFWKRLPAAIGRPELAQDPRFGSMRERIRNREALIAELSEVFSEDTASRWIERIEGADIPACRVNSLQDTFSLEQARANEILVRVAHPTRGEIEILNSPIRMQGSPQRVTRGAPTLGAHTAEILDSFGLDRAEQERLRAAGVI